MEKLRILNIKHNSPQWYEFRRHSLGASEAAAAIGISPYKTNVELWEEKIGLAEPRDISDNPRVKYGLAAERPLVELFKLDHPEYDVKVNKNVVYQRGFAHASLDAELRERETRRRGVLEVKTTELQSAAQLREWTDRVPGYYYAQNVHQLYTTGWDFVVLLAQIKFAYKRENLIRAYLIERNENEIDYLYKCEARLWDAVQSKQRPPLILPPL